MATSAHVLYFDAPERISVRVEDLPAPGPNEVQVRTLISAISPGTEMLFFRGHAPAEMSLDVLLPGMDKPPSYPIRYGYACVGEVVAAGHAGLEIWLGRRVFAFQPHTSHFNIQPDHILPVPNGVETTAAALFPNMETAVSLLHDGAPLVGERAMIFGQGIVGLLTTWLLSSARLASLITVDPIAERRTRSLAYGAQGSHDPDDLTALRGHDPDLILELTGNPSALAAAVTIAGYHCRIIIGSWYGAKSVALPLGNDFHRNRITLYSSQVSTLPAALNARWDKARRYQTAWANLAQLPYQELITHCFRVDEAQTAYELIAKQPEATCQVLLTYAV